MRPAARIRDLYPGEENGLPMLPPEPRPRPFFDRGATLAEAAIAQRLHAKGVPRTHIAALLRLRHRTVDMLIRMGEDEA